jgi:hypothetical protein
MDEGKLMASALLCRGLSIDNLDVRLKIHEWLKKMGYLKPKTH